jgi:GPH family glycoside/pentoside/hexuronide:cation symporter
MDTKKKRPFGWADRIGYAFGDFGNDFTFILSSMFLMKFYTDIMGVSAAIVGIMMMVARFVDAITDVTMGQIADRSPETAKGKFAPWLRRMCGPVAVASFLMYAIWLKNMPMTVKVIWMFATYLLWGSVCYTGINIPYGSMASAISAEPKDRASLSTWRSIGATLAGTAVGVILPMIVYYRDAAGRTKFNGEKMMIAAAVCSVLAVICYLLCYFLTTERVKIEAVEGKFSFVDLVKTTVANRSMIGIILAAWFLLIAQLTLGSMANYIYPFYFNNAGVISSTNLINTVVTLVLSVFATQLSMKIGRREVGIVSSLIGAAALIVAFVLRTRSVQTWLILYSICYIGLAMFNLIVWAMITDVIDDIEVKRGERRDGAVYSVYSFARKLGQAASSGVTGILLSAIGYTTITATSPSVVNGIYNITCLVPAIGFIGLALMLIFVYPLSKKKVEENARFLADKKQKQ